MLNDTQCRNAKPKAISYKLTDGKGLYLEVKPNGVKAWRYRFELSGKESVFAVGEYPNMGLADARQKRQEVRELVKQGINPAHQRQLDKISQEQANATTFEAVSLEWLALKDWEEITKAKRLAMLGRVAFPFIGKMPVRQITPAHVLGILTKTTKNNGASVMAEAKRTMYGIFELASETFRVDANPVHRWREALPTNKTQHKRALSADEIGQLRRDLEGYPGNHQTVVAFKLMWLTLCRPSEATESRWSEFDLDGSVWRILADRMKKRKEHVIPLPSQAVDLLRTMQGITGRHAHVFPGRDDRTDSALRQALRKPGMVW